MEGLVDPETLYMKQNCIGMFHAGLEHIQSIHPLTLIS